MSILVAEHGQGLLGRPPDIAYIIHPFMHHPGDEDKDKNDEQYQYGYLKLSHALTTGIHGLNNSAASDYTISKK